LDEQRPVAQRLFMPDHVFPQRAFSRVKASEIDIGFGLTPVSAIPYQRGEV